MDKKRRVGGTLVYGAFVVAIFSTAQTPSDLLSQRASQCSTQLLYVSIGCRHRQATETSVTEKDPSVDEVRPQRHKLLLQFFRHTDVLHGNDGAIVQVQLE